MLNVSPIGQTGQICRPGPTPAEAGPCEPLSAATPDSRAETTRADEKPIVRRTARSPATCVPSERRAQGVTFPAFAA